MTHIESFLFLQKTIAPFIDYMPKQKYQPIQEGVKPCPFCKSDDTYVGFLYSTVIAGQCRSCGANGSKRAYDQVDANPERYGETMDDWNCQLAQEALELWNAAPR